MWDFAYTKKKIIWVEIGGSICGYLRRAVQWGPQQISFFLNQYNDMNGFWRSTIGAGSYTAEWVISSRIKNLPKPGFKWGGSSRNKSWILGGKWIEGTLDLFGQ
jgi:hypothetical protein